MRARWGIAAGLAFSLACLPAPTFAAVKVGSKCSIAGAIKYGLICKKVAQGRLVWAKKRVETPPTLIPIANIPSTTPVTPSWRHDPVLTAMDELVRSVTPSSDLDDLKITTLIEPADNGPFQAMIHEELHRALRYYKSAFGLPFTELTIMYFRTQDWIRNTTSLYCNEPPKTSRIGTSADGGCKNNDLNQGIHVELLGLVTRWTQSDELAPLSGYTITDPSRIGFLRTVMPHESWHAMQAQFHRMSKDRRFPDWFSEGSASVMALVILAAQSGTYTDWLIDQEAQTAEGDASRIRCTDSIRTLETNRATQCIYTQGSRAVELLLTQYGGYPALWNIMRESATKSFSEAFQSATGSDLDSFYTEVDTYSRRLGWASRTR